MRTVFLKWRLLTVVGFFSGLVTFAGFLYVGKFLSLEFERDGDAAAADAGVAPRFEHLQVPASDEVKARMFRRAATEGQRESNQSVSASVAPDATGNAAPGVIEHQSEKEEFRSATCEITGATGKQLEANESSQMVRSMEYCNHMEDPDHSGQAEELPTEFTDINMASDGEMVVARSKEKEIVLESDEIVTGPRDKDYKSDELLHNGEVLDISRELQRSEYFKLPQELQTTSSVQSSPMFPCTDCSPLFSRCNVDNPVIGNNISESFSIVCYNILAECHAGGEYGSAPWIKPEQLNIEYRHQNILLELEFLNADAVCLQEVGQHYYSTTLVPAMKRLGYKGQFLRRLGEKHDEGEATFYKTSCFDLVSYKEVFFSQIAEKDIETMDVDLDVKVGLRSAVASHAVMLLTRLSLKAVGKIITLGNIHVAFDDFKRPDLQCIQIALAMRELIAASRGNEEPSIICGDFNCFPDTAPYQLLESNHLTQGHISSLMKVTCADGQRSPLATFWPEGFCYPEIAMKSAYKTILGTEPITCWGIPWICSLDYIWYSSARLTVKSILKTVDEKATEKGLPNNVFPSDHLSLKATFMLK